MTHDDHLARLYTDNERASFFKELYTEIVDREERRADEAWVDEVLLKLEAVRTYMKQKDLKTCEHLCQCGDIVSNPTDSLLHKVVLFKRDKRLIERLVEIQPGLLDCPRKFGFEGQTVLHIAVSRGDIKVVDCILKLHKMHKGTGKQSLDKGAAVEVTIDIFGLTGTSDDRNWESKDMNKHLLWAQATGSEFDQTVLMGELPLTTAALTLNKEMVDLLLGADKTLYKQANSKKETVLHSLVRWAAQEFCKEEKEKEVKRKVVDMLSHISQHIVKQQAEDAVDVWTALNEDGLSALKLAATLGVPEVFEFIINLDSVYRFANMEDGISNTYRYDVREIDTVAQRDWFRKEVLDKETNKRPKKCKIARCCKTCFANSCCCIPRTTHKQELHSALEMIANLSPYKANQFFRIDLVQRIVRKKWEKYKYFFYLCFFLHVVLLFLLSAYAVCRANVNSRDRHREKNDISGPEYRTEEEFVEVFKYLSIPAFLVPIIQEMHAFFVSAGCFCFNKKQFRQYRICLGAFALSLFADFCASFVDQTFNFFLVLALLFGYFFCTFFIRVFRKFAFFIELFTKVIVGDMARFSFFIILSLSSFAISMYLILKPIYPQSDNYRQISQSFMLMFKTMFGLDANQELYKAGDEAWLAYSLFIIFLVLTFVLLLNTLIAMMSLTCSYVAEQKDLHFELQRLCVIIMLEGYLPWLFSYRAGKENCRFFYLGRDNPEKVWQYLMVLPASGAYASPCGEQNGRPGCGQNGGPGGGQSGGPGGGQNGGQGGGLSNGQGDGQSNGQGGGPGNGQGGGQANEHGDGQANGHGDGQSGGQGDGHGNGQGGGHGNGQGGGQGNGQGGTHGDGQGGEQSGGQGGGHGNGQDDGHGNGQGGGHGNGQGGGQGNGQGGTHGNGQGGEQSGGQGGAHGNGQGGGQSGGQGGGQGNGHGGGQVNGHGDGQGNGHGGGPVNGHGDGQGNGQGGGQSSRQRRRQGNGQARGQVSGQGGGQGNGQGGGQGNGQGGGQSGGHGYGQRNGQNTRQNAGQDSPPVAGQAENNQRPVLSLPGQIVPHDGILVRQGDQDLYRLVRPSQRRYVDVDTI